MSQVNVTMTSEKIVRVKPTNGAFKRNSCLVTHWNSELLGTDGKYNMAFLPIPKNASSSLRNLVWVTTYKSKQLWSDPAFPSDLMDHWQRVDDIVVVLRNPYDRFMSALNMFLSTRPCEGGIMKTDLSFDEVSLLNEHVYTQRYYLEDCIKNTEVWKKIKFFYMSNTEDVTRDIVQKYPQLVRDEDSKMNHENQSVRIVTEVNRELIRSIYKADFDLIENVEFENSQKISFE